MRIAVYRAGGVGGYCGSGAAVRLGAGAGVPTPVQFIHAVLLPREIEARGRAGDGAADGRRAGRPGKP